MRCAARRYNKTMMCGLCGLQWEFNDPERPQCNPVKKKEAPMRQGAVIIDEAAAITEEQWEELKRAVRGQPDGKTTNT